MITFPPGPNVLGRLLLNASKPPATVYFGVAGLLLQEFLKLDFLFLVRDRLDSSATLGLAYK
jgi:hypothetical protein